MSTKSFFLKKPATAFVLVILVSATATARLDETQVQFETRYGKSLHSGIMFSEFFQNGFKIEAYYLSSLRGADVITYQKIGTIKNEKIVPPTLAEVNANLNENIQAGAWEKISPTEWTHRIEKKSAVYVREECRLYVFRNNIMSESDWNDEEKRIRELFINNEKAEKLCKWPDFYRTRDVVINSRKH